mgnify:CR=1 FL=1
MNMNEKDIDHLTRKLMRGTAEQPSASLNSRIMADILYIDRTADEHAIQVLFLHIRK